MSRSQVITDDATSRIARPQLLAGEIVLIRKVGWIPWHIAAENVTPRIYFHDDLLLLGRLVLMTQ